MHAHMCAHQYCASMHFRSHTCFVSHTHTVLRRRSAPSVVPPSMRRRRPPSSSRLRQRRRSTCLRRLPCSQQLGMRKQDAKPDGPGEDSGHLLQLGCLLLGLPRQYTNTIHCGVHLYMGVVFPVPPVKAAREFVSGTREISIISSLGLHGCGFQTWGFPSTCLGISEPPAGCRMHVNRPVVGTVLLVHRGLLLWLLASGRSARPLWARLGPGGSSHGECPTPCGSHHAEPCGSHYPAARLRPPGFPPPQGKFRKPGVARCFGRFGIRGCSFY